MTLQAAHLKGKNSLRVKFSSHLVSHVNPRLHCAVLAFASSSLRPSRGLSARAVGAPKSQALPASCPCVCSQVGGCIQGSALNPGHTRTTPAPPAPSPGSSEKPHSLGSVGLSDTDLWGRAGAGAENQEGNKEATKTGQGLGPQQ